MKPHIFPKPIEEIYENLEWKKHPVIFGSGIYKLSCDGRVVYVGMSNRLSSRLATHMSFKRFFFDKVEYANCSHAEAPFLERIAIQQFEPENNTKYTSKALWKAEKIRRIEQQWSDIVDRFVAQY